MLCFPPQQGILSRSTIRFPNSRQIPWLARIKVPPIPLRRQNVAEMAEQEGENPTSIDEPHKLEIPTRRVKNIMKLDKDINKVNSEALFLVATSTELFLQFLAEKSAQAAIEKKRKTITLEHIRVAVKRHRPTADFLLDSLPMPPRPTDQNRPGDRAKSRPDKKPVPFATRSIDAFFQKST